MYAETKMYSDSRDDETMDGYGDYEEVEEVDPDDPCLWFPHGLTPDAMIKQHMMCAFDYLLRRKVNNVASFLKAIANGEPLGHKKDIYAFKVIDEFRIVMRHLDYLIEYEGLKEKDGATTRLRWEFGLRPNFMYAFGNSEANRLAIRIVNTTLWEWCQVRPNQGLESYYMSAGMYETHLGKRPSEVVMFVINMLDQEFFPMMYRRYDGSTGRVMNPNAQLRPMHTLDDIKRRVTPMDKHGRIKPNNLVHDYRTFLKVANSRGARSRWASVPVIGRFWAKRNKKREQHLAQRCREI